MSESPDSSAAVTIVISDDSELVRIGLRTLLECEPEDGSPRCRIVGEAGSHKQTLSEVERTHPQVLLLDIRLGDGSGLDICRQLVAADSGVKILILTSVLDDQLIYEALSSGANGYLLKEINVPALRRAIADVTAGKFVLDPSLTSRVLKLVHEEKQENVLSLLSPQQQRLLALVAEGKTNKEIGAEMELSEKTVKNYLSGVFEKLKISRRSQAAVLYFKNQR